MPVAVHNLAQLNRTFNKAPKDIKRAYRAELRTVAEPVRSTWETLAVSSIRRIGPKWSRARIGPTVNLVYVAPRLRGIKGRGRHPRRRPNLADLLMARAAEPALAQNQHRIEADFERMLDRLVNRWDSEGP
jgi:hypothetical protein